jgi:nucleoside-diphosphate-sugar epimerase
MKALIVGGNSSLGRALVQQWRPQAEVIVAGRGTSELAVDLATPLPPLPAGLDVVVNTAAHFGGKQPSDIAAAVEVNVVGALRLAEACRRAGAARLVHVSTIFAELPVDSPLQSAYATTKRQADELLQMACASSGLPLTIVRPSQFVGVGQALRRHQPFLATLFDKASRGEAIEIWGRGTTRRNYIHVADVARAIAGLTEQGLDGVYACQSLQDVSMAEVASAAIEAFGGRSTLRFLEDKPDLPNNTLPIAPRLHELLGFSPSISLRECFAAEANDWPQESRA